MIKLIKNAFYPEASTRRRLSAFILKTRQLSFGPECLTFEKEFAEYQGRKYCVFLNSGSSANIALIQSLKNLGRLQDRDSVGFSELTWPTNVAPLIQLGLAPVPIDVELETLNTSSRLLASVAQQKPLRAFFVTNLLGLCSDLDAIQRFCKKNNIMLLEDNCEGLGSVYHGKKFGNFGLASTFSFYVGHHMSTIEGGAVCTDDRELADMLRMVRAHGWDRHLAPNRQAALRKKHNISPFHGLFTFYDLGYNFRPTEIAGFLGRQQLRHLPAVNKKRNENFLRIAPLLYQHTDRFIPLQYKHIDFLSIFSIPILCRDERVRDELVEKCKGIIEVRPIIGGAMAQQPFLRKYLAENQIHMNSNASIIHRQGLYCGNNPDMTKRELEIIRDIFTS